MLTLFGHRERFCDGVSRRNFMRIGAIGAGGFAAMGLGGGLTLPRLLRAEADAGIRRSNKAVIMVYLPGGPSHQDMLDLKPDAPPEVRGEFNPIKTSVAGIQICEHLPRLAAMMEKLVVIRSVSDSDGSHGSFQCLTGRKQKNMPPGGWPALGAVVSKLGGAGGEGIPPFISLSGGGSKREGAEGFLGVAHAPFQPSGKGRADMTLNGVTLERLDDRKKLLEGMDRLRRDVDASGMMEGLDAFNQQAMSVLTSSRLAAALDIKKEDPRILEAYRGAKDSGRALDSFLVARRLVEAGARCVTLSFGGWDSHSNNFKSMKERLPQLDQGMAALINDLHQRGLSDDVSVVMWGEFGRTPKINKNAGRDHWPKVSCALLAGGGMKTGQVIGATDRDAAEVASRPVRFGEVFATLYANLGIDVSRATLPDLGGRPQYLVEAGLQPMPELV